MRGAVQTSLGPQSDPARQVPGAFREASERDPSGHVSGERGSAASSAHLWIPAPGLHLLCHGQSQMVHRQPLRPGGEPPLSASPSPGPSDPWAVLPPPSGSPVLVLLAPEGRGRCRRRLQPQGGSASTGKAHRAERGLPWILRLTLQLRLHVGLVKVSFLSSPPGNPKTVDLLPLAGPHLLRLCSSVFLAPAPVAELPGRLPSPTPVCAWPSCSH